MNPNYKENKNSIGKYFRKQKGLRKADKKGKKIEPNSIQNLYFEELKKNGAIIDSVELAEFQLENGLKYTGLIATKDIPTNTHFIRIPKELILNTKIAYFSELKKLFIENPSFFSKEGSSSWEDHILLVYLLREAQKGNESRWFSLIQNLPKEIDYVIFWTDEELRLLDDEFLLKKVRRERSQFENDFNELVEILKKYPNLFTQESFSWENVKWIHTHLVSRCFGKFLAFVSMVPFCELLNHECVDVYYDFEYQEGNEARPKSYDPSGGEKKYLNEEDEENHCTSEGTYNSEDEYSDSDFFEENEFQKDFNQNKKYYEQLKELYDISIVIKSFLYNYIDYGDSFSIFYVAKVSKRMEKVFDSLKKTEISISDGKRELLRIQQISYVYKTELYKYYKEIENKSSFSIRLCQKDSQAINKVSKKKEDEKNKNFPASKKYFAEDEKWENDLFDYFVMKTSISDTFEEGSQVYFCYGRLSNRTLLLRYGFCLPFNKYDHVFLRIDLLKLLSNNLEGKKILVEHSLPTVKSFKIKFTKLNLNIIAFFKSLLWNLDKQVVDTLFYPFDLDLELQALEKVKFEYENFLLNCKISEEENEAAWKNPKSNYHEYFAAVYRKGRRDVISQQLKLVQICIEIVKRIKSGSKFDESLSIVSKLEYAEDFPRHRYLLKNYTKRLEFALINKKEI